MDMKTRIIFVRTLYHTNCALSQDLIVNHGSAVAFMFSEEWKGEKKFKNEEETLENRHVLC